MKIGIITYLSFIFVERFIDIFFNQIYNDKPGTTNLKNNFTSATHSGYDSLLRRWFLALPVVIRSFRRQIRI